MRVPFPAPLTSGVTLSSIFLYSLRSMLLRRGRKRLNSTRRYPLMKALVDSLSLGRFHNEAELFSCPVSDDNLQLMGQMIALQVFRNVLSFDFKVVEKLYNGLIKDLHHSNEPNYVISDGYDYVQIAICFLLPFKGKCVYEIYSHDKKGKPVTIKSACFRHVDSRLMKFRRKNAQQRQIDFTNNKEMLVDPIDCFDNSTVDYSKADTILHTMHLTVAEMETLNCYMNGMQQSQVASFLGITVFGVKYRKARIRQKYQTYIGSYPEITYSYN